MLLESIAILQLERNKNIKLLHGNSEIFENIKKDIEKSRELWVALFETLKSKKSIFAIYDIEDKEYLITVNCVNKDTCQISVFPSFVKNMNEAKSFQKLPLIFNQLVNLCQFGVVIIKNLKVIFINKKMEEMGGYSIDEVVGKNFIDFFDENCKKEIMQIHSKRVFFEVEEPERTWQAVLIKKNGEKMEVECNVARTIVDEEPAVIATVKDISHYKKLLDIQEKNYYMDELTEVMNRKKLSIDFPFFENGKFIGMIDLINFKYINEKMGYIAGDELLKNFSLFLKNCNILDGIYRIGGDEFLVTFKENNSEKIENFFRSKETYPDFRLAVCEKQESLRGTLERLDFCIQNLKETSENFKIFDKEMKKLFSMKKRLIKKLKDDEWKKFDVSFQHIVDRRRKIVGYEFFMNFNNYYENEDTVKKELIIKELSKFDLMYEIFNKKLKIIENFLIKNKIENKRLHFNLDSSLVINHVDETIKALKNFKEKIDNCEIVLEITEEFNYLKNKNNIENIKKFRNSGFTISLDDFGEGYSSLEYIVNLPIDIIKFDKKFVKIVDHKIERIIKSIISIPERPCIIEGIETEKDYSVFKKLGFKEFQGFLFHKPQLINYE